MVIWVSKFPGYGGRFGDDVDPMYCSNLGHPLASSPFLPIPTCWHLACIFSKLWIRPTRSPRGFWDTFRGMFVCDVLLTCVEVPPPYPANPKLAHRATEHTKYNQDQVWPKLSKQNLVRASPAQSFAIQYLKLIPQRALSSAPAYGLDIHSQFATQCLISFAETNLRAARITQEQSYA